MKIQKQNRSNKRGAALVEYGLIVAGVALVAAAAVAVFGHKTAGIIGATARILPGAQAEDNGLVAAGQIVETNETNGVITIDTSNAALNGQEGTINDNLGLGNSDLINDPTDN